MELAVSKEHGWTMFSSLLSSVAHLAPAPPNFTGVLRKQSFELERRERRRCG